MKITLDKHILVGYYTYIGSALARTTNEVQNGNAFSGANKENRMTKNEAAIISAFTGKMIGKFSDMHEYVEKLFGHPVFTHMFANEDFVQKVKDLSYNDFIQLHENIE